MELTIPHQVHARVKITRADGSAEITEVVMDVTTAEDEES